MKRVCHISSAHVGLDSRIFHKECVSLAAAGYETHLVISANQDEVRKASEHKIILHPVVEASGRLSRVLRKTRECYKISRRINADIYHFHDPELIFVGMALSLYGKKVIYDVHEDVPTDILSKEWISPWLRKGAAWAARLVEAIGARFFFHIVTSTPYIRDRFLKYTPRAIDIKNYPHFKGAERRVEWCEKKNEICYIGTISKIRGIREICSAFDHVETEAKLVLAGQFNEPDVEKEVRSLPCWNRVDYLGLIEHDSVYDVLQRSVAGLVTLHPLANFKEALPIKMFEYMQAGIPVIASDFPLWREIIERSRCGILVDPLNPSEIADAIDFLVAHPEIACEMGRNGRVDVLNVYNWQAEERSLIALYEELTRF